MINKCIEVAAISLFLCTVGCAASAPYNPFKVDEEEFFRTAKTVALSPVQVPTDIADSEPVKDKFETLLLVKLRQAGFTVVPSKEWSGIWERMTGEMGGYFDPITGKRDDAKLKAVREHAFRELSTKFNPDVLLYPRIVVTNAKWEQGTATWDGVTEQVQPTGDRFMLALIGMQRYGTIPALSFVVSIEDPTGRSLYVNSHGLQALVKVDGKDYRPVPRDTLFEEPRNLAAIDAVMAPIVNRSKTKETALPKP
jgi:hypothetical protein